MADPVESARTQYQRRLDGLKVDRQSWEPHWQDLADWILPLRAFINRQPSSRQSTAGSKANQKIIDGTATYVFRTLQSGMMSGLTSPARPWFRLTTPYPDLNERADVKAWLYDTETAMREVFSRSNTYTGLATMYSDLGVFGTAAGVVLEDDVDVIRVVNFQVGTYYLAQSDRGIVDTIYRCFAMTVRQVVRQFGGMTGNDPGTIHWERFSQSVQKQYKNRQFEAKVNVCHVLEPNADYQPGALQNTRLPWRSVYFEDGCQGDTLLGVGGFEEWPGLTPRWAVYGDDVYGRSPGMDALPDVKQLQAEQKQKLRAIDLLVRPPMNAPASLEGKGGGSLLPGDVTYYDAAGPGQQFTPSYQIRPEIDHLTQDIYELQQRIRRAGYEDLFLMLQSTPPRSGVTAREIEERTEEKLLVLGPVVERQASDLLDPLIDRTFAIMLRKGLIPEPPEELQGMDLRVEYISTLAQAQRMVGTSAIERVGNFVIALATGMQSPEAFDVVDVDQMIQDYAAMQGVPPKQIRDDAAIAELRQARAKAQQLQAAAAAAKPVADAAKAASETQMGGDTALSRMMGGAGGQGAGMVQ